MQFTCGRANQRTNDSLISLFFWIWTSVAVLYELTNKCASLPAVLSNWKSYSIRTHTQLYMHYWNVLTFEHCNATSWPYYNLLSLAQALCMHMETHTCTVHTVHPCAHNGLLECHTHSLGRCIPMYIYLHTVSITLTDTCTFTYSTVQQYPCIALRPTLAHIE